jgi:hypothetical protein
VLRRTSGLVAALAALLLAGAAAAAPGDKAFTIANYPVDASAKDAVAAKEKAIAEGTQAAFRSLLKRLVPVTGYTSLERLRTVKAADFVDGFSIRSEQNSGTRYIASLDFNFEPNTVRQLLQREGIAFVDAQAEPVILVPVLRQGEGAAATYAPASGSWATVWQDLDAGNALAPLQVMPLKASVHTDTIAGLISGQGTPEQILATEYGSDKVVVAIAEVDKAGQRVHVTLAGQDAVAPLSWRRSYRIIDNDVGYAMELAAVISLGVVEGRWKAQQNGDYTGAQGGGLPDVLLDVQFRSMSEWNQLRGQILDLPKVDDVRVGNVATGSAQVMVKYPGGGRAMAGDLAHLGLQMQPAGDGWMLRSGY